MSPFIAAHPAVVPPNATAVGANGFGVGGASLGRLGRTTLALGGFTIPDIVADLSTQKQGALADPFVSGNIGAGVFKRFTVTFDYPHQIMALAPGRAFAARDGYERAGVFVVSQAGKVVVADVRPGTPAAEAGLARGDAIATVDGTAPRRRRRGAGAVPGPARHHAPPRPHRQGRHHPHRQPDPARLRLGEAFGSAAPIGPAGAGRQVRAVESGQVATAAAPSSRARPDQEFARSGRT